jgi:hypothetical protein
LGEDYGLVVYEAVIVITQGKEVDFQDCVSYLELTGLPNCGGISNRERDTIPLIHIELPRNTRFDEVLKAPGLHCNTKMELAPYKTAHFSRKQSWKGRLHVKTRQV